MGGTCDSVGVGGCWTAGCFGPFTKRFGSGAINILQARVALANGTLVTASKCSHPDLFMSLRGGGGGLAGVVIDFVARSHRAPTYTSRAEFAATANTPTSCHALVAKTLQASAMSSMNGTAGTLCDNGGLQWSCGADGGHASISCSAYEGDPAAMKKHLQPLSDWAKLQPATIHGVLTGFVDWNTSAFDPSHPTASLPWMEKHPDREISTALLASMSRFFPARYMATAEGSAALATAIVNISNLLSEHQVTLPTIPFMGAKGQAGLSMELTAEFHTTGLNPVMLDAVGTWLIVSGAGCGGRRCSILWTVARRTE